MIRLELAGMHTRLHSTLCGPCSQGPTGCCASPPGVEWSDIGRIVSLGGAGWLLEQMAAGNLRPGRRAACSSCGSSPRTAMAERSPRGALSMVMRAAPSPPSGARRRATTMFAMTPSRTEASLAGPLKRWPAARRMTRSWISTGAGISSSPTAYANAGPTGLRGTTISSTGSVEKSAASRPGQRPPCGSSGPAPEVSPRIFRENLQGDGEKSPSLLYFTKK